MFRQFGKNVLAFGTLALIGSPAWAQAQKVGGRFGGMSADAILMSENVHKDLKLTEEQVGKIQETLQGGSG